MEIIKMYGYIYKTTNLLNNKIYVGKHKCEIFIGNKYLGSGKHIRAAIIKYGKENFIVELLEECYSKEDLNKKEQYWIKSLDARNINIGYNISIGGDGEGTPGHAPTFTGPHSEESKQKNREGTRNWNLSRSKEDYKQVSEHHVGSKIMNNGFEQKWVWKDEIQSYLDNGWKIGSCKKRNRDYSSMRGEGNPNYNNTKLKNTIWVFKVVGDKIEKHQINISEYERYKAEGFERGMKPHYNK